MPARRVRLNFFPRLRGRSAPSRREMNCLWQANCRSSLEIVTNDKIPALFSRHLLLVTFRLTSPTFPWRRDPAELLNPASRPRNASGTTPQPRGRSAEFFWSFLSSELAACNDPRTSVSVRSNDRRKQETGHFWWTGDRASRAQSRTSATLPIRRAGERYDGTACRPAAIRFLLPK
jgi:hypothetical protein